MMQDKALPPSPTPALKTGGGNELFWIYYISFNMGTAFCIFLLFLFGRHINRKELQELDNEMGQSKRSVSEKRESLYKRFNSSYGTFRKNTESAQYMMLFQKYSESPSDKPLYTIAFYTPTLHDPALKSAYTLSPCKSTEPPATKPTARISFFDSNTQSTIKSRSPISDNGENTSLSDPSSAISDSQQKWIHSLSPISSNQNALQCTASGSKQTLSKWLLSPSANVNEQDTPKWVLSPQGMSREGSDLYSIDDPHLSVPMPTNTPFIIELKTTLIPSEQKRDIKAIDERSTEQNPTPSLQCF